MITFLQRKVQKGRASNCDVLITYSIISCSGGVKKKSLRYSFSEKAVRMMCGSGLYGMIGFDEKRPERIYFCSANKNDGYKLTRNSATGTRYQSSFGTQIKYTNPENFIGEYDLEYDALQSAFYIDRNNRK